MNIIKKILLALTPSPIVYNSQTGERMRVSGGRFQAFFLIKINNWEEYDEFVLVCKKHNIVLSQAISSMTFWDVFKTDKWNKNQFPFWFFIEKDAAEIRFAYVRYCKAEEDVQKYKMATGGIGEFIEKLNPYKISAEQLFYAETDKYWNSASLEYGSFDKIPTERKNALYRFMDMVASDVGYDGYKSADHIK